MAAVAALRSVAMGPTGFWRKPGAGVRSRPDWIAIAIFFTVACVWSHLAGRLGPPMLPGGADAPRVDAGLLVGFGPVLGALVADLVRPSRARRCVGFAGRRPLWTVVGLGVPIVVAALIGFRRFHVEAHVDAAVTMLSLVVACSGEELGWREWLFNALAGIPLWASVLVTWALWLLWHLAFPPELVGLSGPYDLGFTVALLAMSTGLAVVVRKTRSSGLAAAWHAIARVGGPAPAVAATVLLLGAASWAAARRPRVTP